MIRKILSIRDFRLFQDWRWSAGAKEFGSVNVIYGVNGSGKSTLSALMAQAPTDQTWRSGLKLTVETVAGEVRTVDSASDSFWANVHIFNKDYVANNLRFDSGDSSTAMPLLVLGQQRIDQLEVAEQLEGERKEQEGLVEGKSREATAAAKLADTIAKSVADTLGEELGNSGIDRYRPRSYNAGTAKSVLAAPAPFDPAKVSTNVAQDLEIVTTPPQEQINLPLPNLRPISEFVDAVSGLLGRVPSAAVIAELRDDATRAAWVQQGLSLHVEGDKCSFCEGVFTSEQATKLGRHFDRSLRDLQQELARAKGAVEQALASTREFTNREISVPIYPTLTANWKTALAKLLEAGKVYIGSLELLNSTIAEKQGQLFRVVDLPSGIDSDAVVDVGKIRELIDEHNEVVQRSAQMQKDAAERIEHARIEAARAQYEQARKDAEEAGAELRAAERRIVEIDEELHAANQTDMDALPLAAELTQDLARLLGRQELEFAMEGEGYVIRRKSESAVHLSEGEKTAISLLYFMKSLDAHGVNREESVIIVDDPVSSLDSNVIAGVSGHLWSRLVGRNAGEAAKCRQIILFTHNFDFFRMWSNQLDRLHEKQLSQQEITYTIQDLRVQMTALNDGSVRREPVFVAWPDDKKMRERMRSEYHYLFWYAGSTLVECQSSPSTETELRAAAILPNVCRRLLEAFLSFKYPGRIGDLRGQMSEAIDSLDSNATRTRLVTFLHQYSHNEQGDITRAIARPESVAILGAVFNLIAHVDRDHYEKMLVAVGLEIPILDV